MKKAFSILTKEEVIITLLALCCTCLLVFTLYFATAKWDTREVLDECHDLLIQEAIGHKHQLAELVTQLNLCLELHNEE